MLVVLGIMAVLAGMAGLQIVQARPTLQADAAMRVVASQIRIARERAITERRCIRIAFGADGVTLTREEVPGPAVTVLSTVGFESGMRVGLTPGLPDTPDAFGNARADDFGTAAVVKFSPDGTLVDQDGNSASGSVFLAQPGQPRAARALTVLGSTGRVRAYRWDGNAWRLI